MALATYKNGATSSHKDPVYLLGILCRFGLNDVASIECDSKREVSKLLNALEAIKKKTRVAAKTALAGSD